MSNTSTQLGIGRKAMEGLLGEFRVGNFAERGVEKIRLKRHLGELSRLWDERFPGLPEEPFAYSSLRGISRRGVRDAYLKGIIVELLGGGEGGVIVNPACVWGRHARDLAKRLPGRKVLATDINPRYERLYNRWPRSRGPGNYEFVADDIFNPKIEARPSAVVFFGACGSLSDAAMEYAIESKCPLLACRVCCHVVIGGNTDIVKRQDFVNRLSRFAIFILTKRLAELRKQGHYFSPRYSPEHYPRSQTAGKLTDSKEMIQVARNAASSDICRSIIDLDRYLHLAEAGYNVWYRAEMFVAQLAASILGTGPQRHEAIE